MQLLRGYDHMVSRGQPENPLVEGIGLVLKHRHQVVGDSGLVKKAGNLGKAKEGLYLRSKGEKTVRPVVVKGL